MSLGRLVQDVATARADLRSQDASDRAIAEATEALVRHYWQPLVPPEREWPPWASGWRCADCHGTGLVLTTETTRIGTVADVGRPCQCGKGQRFRPAPVEEAHTTAGKVPKKQPTRWGQR